MTFVVFLILNSDVMCTNVTHILPNIWKSPVVPFHLFCLISENISILHNVTG